MVPLVDRHEKAEKGLSSLTRRSRKPWNTPAFLRGKKRKSEVCSRPLVRFWLVSPTFLLGNQKRPRLSETGKWKERFPEPRRACLSHAEPRQLLYFMLFF